LEGRQSCDAIELVSPATNATPGLPVPLSGNLPNAKEQLSSFAWESADSTIPQV